MKVRNADRIEIPQIAQVWYDAWQDAHAAILPVELKRVRTLESFRERLEAAVADVRVVGDRGKPLGFHMLKHDELYQLFVAAEARGTGVAAALVADAEHRLATAGVDVAWLSCAIGNDRAARFYEKCGWRRTGVMVSQLQTPNGVLSLEVWRYEKRLRP